MLACARSRYSWICKPAWCLPRLGGEAYSQKALTVLGEPVQGLFRIAQSYLNLTLCLIFQTEGSKWCGFCSALGNVLVGHWLRVTRRGEGKMATKKAADHTLYHLSSKGFWKKFRAFPQLRMEGHKLEILIWDLEYRRRHSCEPRDIFCESPAPAWVENRIIQHPCYSWYAAQTSC